jgi:hypothetical protein
MGDIKYGYTTEELYDNYTFKLIRRALMREFPYIKNVFVNPPDLGRFNTIFLNFDFDPSIWGEMYNDPMVKWLKDVTDKGGYIDFSYPNTGTNMGYDEYYPIKKSIENVMSDVFNSEAVPPELKIQGNRPVAIGTWHVNRRSGTPDYTF